MKKPFLLLPTILLTGISFSQAFFENFDASATLPTGWAQYNQDGLTPHATIVGIMGTNAWVVRPNKTTGAGNHITSTSRYITQGTSDDWLVSPVIAVPSAGSYVLEFDAQAQNSSYADGFNVYVSTTGNAVSNFSSAAIMTQAAAASNYTTYTVPLTAYAGQNIYIAIQNNSFSKELLNIDNFIVYRPLPNDANLKAATLNHFSLLNTDNSLAFTVKNNGTNPITSFTVSWNDGTDHSSVIPCSIGAGAVADFIHPIAINYAAAFEKNIAITITGVNGSTDPSPGNNSTTRLFHTVNQSVAKAVVFEEGTGTWCGWCPIGAVAIEHEETLHPDNFIGIAIHNGDPMTVAAYDAAAAFSGFPGSIIDRILPGAVNSQSFDSYYNDRSQLVAPAAINVSTSVAGSDVTLDVAATFYTPFAAANYRLGVIISEDKVHGTSASYDQHNYYSHLSQNIALNGAGHNWQAEPATIPAANMEYDHVGRALLGGYNGQSGSVPAVITTGQVANYTFNYTIPATSVRENMRAIAVLIDQSTGEIVNAKKVAVSSLGIEEKANMIAMQVYPNPATDVVNVRFEGKGGNYTVSITDLSGREMGTSTVSNANGSQHVTLAVDSLAGGNYLVTISDEGASYTQQVVVR